MDGKLIETLEEKEGTGEGAAEDEEASVIAAAVASERERELQAIDGNSGVSDLVAGSTTLCQKCTSTRS